MAGHGSSCSPFLPLDIFSEKAWHPLNCGIQCGGCCPPPSRIGAVGVGAGPTCETPHVVGGGRLSGQCVRLSAGSVRQAGRSVPLRGIAPFSYPLGALPDPPPHRRCPSPTAFVWDAGA